MHYDVVIARGGPASLSASVRLCQLLLKMGTNLSMCILEKGSEVGLHVLSGNVFNPRALEGLLLHGVGDGGKGDGGNDGRVPLWTEALLESQGSHATPVSKDAFLVLTELGGSYRIPSFLLPKQLHNDGNYVISLGKLTRYLGTFAEALGVEIYPGFAADKVLYADEDDRGGGVRGVATKDVGIGKDGRQRETFERGVEVVVTPSSPRAQGDCAPS